MNTQSAAEHYILRNCTRTLCGGSYSSRLATAVNMNQRARASVIDTVRRRRRQRAQTCEQPNRLLNSAENLLRRNLILMAPPSNTNLLAACVPNFISIPFSRNTATRPAGGHISTPRVVRLPAGRRRRRRRPRVPPRINVTNQPTNHIQ